MIKLIWVNCFLPLDCCYWQQQMLQLSFWGCLHFHRCSRKQLNYLLCSAYQRPKLLYVKLYMCSGSKCTISTLISSRIRVLQLVEVGHYKSLLSYTSVFLRIFIYAYRATLQINYCTRRYALPVRWRIDRWQPRGLGRNLLRGFPVD